MELEITTLIVLALVALVAGFIDSMAGGGGLITIPALLAAGVPPTMALATNKLQSSFGSFAATLYFLKRGMIDLASMKWAVICTFVGSALGTLLVQQIDSSQLSRILPYLLVGFACYFLFSPRISDSDSHRRLSYNAFALLVGTGVGFYDGFFGPGTGSFFAMAFVALAGLGMAKATAHTKLLNFTSNMASLLFFIIGGKVLWTVGLTMAIGQILGARLGSRMVVAKGVKLIRPLLVTVSLVMCGRLLWQGHPEWFAWIGAGLKAVLPV
ncbi:membrane protein [Pokkaliibacter plantistimulans]|uniref:Probable membrane transporter protein n=1 Tax=Pokkaliibacter plantistimulans TaxID=1635171 RepID=A0ABX5LWE9_9GAMM|nr:TSUP family transporter [Pokkaliibacter plantistimulans]PXF30987.1 membrane protein [Pokkaliibacter plantistimulans]